jgi:hypothetical protein
LFVEAEADITLINSANPRRSGALIDGGDPIRTQSLECSTATLRSTATFACSGHPRHSWKSTAYGTIQSLENLTLNGDSLQVGDTVTGEIVVDDIRNSATQAGKVLFSIPTSSIDLEPGCGVWGRHHQRHPHRRPYGHLPNWVGKG